MARNPAFSYTHLRLRPFTPHPSNPAARCQRMGWDVGRDIIARIESRVHLVTDSEILYLAKALGSPVVELFPGRRDDKDH